MSGLYSIMWTPPAEGKYTIVANFEGSDAYWPSYAETAIGVTGGSGQPTMPASPTPAPDPTTGATESTLYIAIAAAVIIIAVIAVAIALKRRK